MQSAAVAGCCKTGGSGDVAVQQDARQRRRRTGGRFDAAAGATGDVVVDDRVGNGQRSTGIKNCSTAAHRGCKNNLPANFSARIGRAVNVDVGIPGHEVVKAIRWEINVAEPQANSSRLSHKIVRVKIDDDRTVFSDRPNVNVGRRYAGSYRARILTLSRGVVGFQTAYKQIDLKGVVGWVVDERRLSACRRDDRWILLFSRQGKTCGRSGLVLRKR